MNQNDKKRAPRNRTLALTPERQVALLGSALKLDAPATPAMLENRIIHGDIFAAMAFLPAKFIDLLIIDPPYNLSKNFGEAKFRKQPYAEYCAYLESFIAPLVPKLKADATLYVCCDWQSSRAVEDVLARYVTIQNRITWEREKGRGAKQNWKNNSEDIWFCTMDAGKNYVFNLDDVKLKKRIIAPYRDASGKPKDWQDDDDGLTRLTHPSNLWTDISIPFWSMPENTDHPTQKSEKLLAKLILASSKAGAMVFDPFLGSGTTAVTAQKLGRKFCGVEIDGVYAALTLERLERAKNDNGIQGYKNGVFWERNSKVK